jgi:hypothetical protein
MFTKLIVELPDESVRELRSIAARNGITLGAALIQSIHNENFLGEQVTEGGRIIIARKHKLREIIYTDEPRHRCCRRRQLRAHAALSHA